ncbi:MAG: hypothetical protein H7257_02400 [Taibaiella sp.]|nr:hypothetical protein [Taibaiella sp.]
MKPIIIEYKKEHDLREKMLLWLLGNVVEVHARAYSGRKPWGLKREDLLTFAPGTLGNELGHFLQREDLQPVDKIERHDAFHILLDYSTQLSDEAAMQYYLIANGKKSPFTVATALFTGMVMPDYWSKFYKEYKRGRRARSIARWDFKELLDEPYTDIKKVINFEPVNNHRLMKKIEGFELMEQATFF